VAVPLRRRHCLTNGRAAAGQAGSRSLQLYGFPPSFMTGGKPTAGILGTRADTGGMIVVWKISKEL
jgi:hypothetical protein